MRWGLKQAAQKLKEYIEAKSMLMGDTPSGGDWCLKALHPSDPLTDVLGIPDKSAVPSTFLNYQATFTLEPPVGAADSWGFDIEVKPHPVSFLTYNAWDKDSVHSSHGEFLNPQLDGATHGLKIQALRLLGEKWRLAYMGVTCHQDGADLTNQGTLVACQRPVEPIVASVSGPGGPGGVFMLPGTIWQPDDVATFTTSQSMPNAYFGRSREGCYMPLKLNKTCQQWYGDAHLAQNVAVGVAESVFHYTTPTSNVGQWPYYDLPTPSYSASVFSEGEPTSLPLNATWGAICARNLAPTTRFTFFVRLGLELQVQPGTTLSPHLRLSPPYDGRALKTYFAIARELKDAYPADFNDFGKLWNVIKQAASVVMPIVRTMGPIGAGVGALGDMAIRGIDSRVSARERGGSAPSAAAVERARSAVKQIVENRASKRVLPRKR